MKKKHFWTSLGVIVMIVGVLIIINALVSDELEITTTTTLPPYIEGVHQYLDFEPMLAAIPESLEGYDQVKDDAVVQRILIPDLLEEKIPYSIVSRRYNDTSSGDKEVIIVITDTLGLDDLNAFFYERIPLNLTIGYTVPKYIKGYPAWESFEYGVPDKELDGLRTLQIAISGRVIVSINGGKGAYFNDLYTLAEEFDFDSLELAVYDNENQWLELS